VSPEGDLEVISEERLRESLTMADALQAARAALQAYSEGKIEIVASVLDLDRGDVHIKGAHAKGGRYFAVKVASWVPPEGPGRSVHGGGSLVCAAETGQPVALLLDRHYLSSLRTAAASAVAADLLARPNSEVAGMIGTGVQGQLQIEALAEVRPISRILLYGRRREAAERLADALRKSVEGSTVSVVDDVEAVLGAADVVITATAAQEPFVHGGSLRAGQHLSAIGADGDGKAELAMDCFARADRVFVDSLAQSTATAELGAAIAAGAFAKDEVAGEIGEILAGRAEGRVRAEEITVAKMTGIGALDLTIAEAALEKCASGEVVRAAP
jgi:ornithine cyclodeaminase/alanine dehydrogenase-like protein (mu-crystallin family)